MKVFLYKMSVRIGEKITQLISTKLATPVLGQKPPKNQLKRFFIEIN